MITILGLVLILAGVYGWLKALTWLIGRAERIDCEPFGDPPTLACGCPSDGETYGCLMCDRLGCSRHREHDCADPVDQHFATIPQAIDCSTLGDSEVEMLRRNTIEDLTEADRLILDAQFTAAVALFDGPVPYVKGPDQ